MEIKVGYSLEFIDTGKNSEENTGRTDSKNNSKKKKWYLNQLPNIF